MSQLYSLDLRLLRFFRTAGHTPARERVLVRFSRLGEYGACWIGFALLAAVSANSDQMAWLRAAAVIGFVYLVNTALKLVVRRRRPHIAGLPQLSKTPTQLSFPSAHAATSFAGALAASRLLPGLAVVFYLLAVCFAFSRLYLGVHYPSDVLAGALLGVLMTGALT